MAEESFQNNFFDTEYLKADLKGRSVRGGAVTMSAQGAKFFLQMGSTVVLARLLTPQDFGLIAMVTVVVNFATMFKDAGLSMATVQKEEISREQISTLFWINVLASVALGLCVLAASPLVAMFYGKPELTAVTAVLSISFIISGLSIQHAALLRRHMRFGSLAIVQIASQVITLAVTILLVLSGWRYWALVGGSLTTAFSTVLLTFFFCPWVPGPMKKGTGVRDMLKFGGHLTGFNLINYLARNADNILIGRFIGADALGLYAKAYSLLMLPIHQINRPVMSVSVPLLSRLQNSAERFRKSYRTGLMIVTLLGMPIVVLCFVKAETIILLVLGEQWIESVPLFRILSIAAFVGTTSGTGTGSVFIALGNVRRQFLVSLIRTPILLGSFVIGLRWGVTGVAAAYSIYTILTRLPTIAICFYGTPLRISDFLDPVWRPALASIVSGGCLYILSGAYASELHLAADALISLIFYAILYVIVYAFLLKGKQHFQYLYQTIIQFKGQHEPAQF